MPASSYNLKAVTLSIGGIPITGGFGENDAITLEWVANNYSAKTSADGRRHYSVINDETLKVTLTLMPTTRAYTLLAGQMQAQKAAAATGVLLPQAFHLFDLNNGDTFSGDTTVFMTKPSPSKGLEESEVTLELEVPNARALFGTLNTL